MIPGIRPNDGERRVLVLARNYPNEAIPRLGLWTPRFVWRRSE